MSDTSHILVDRARVAIVDLVIIGEILGAMGVLEASGENVDGTWISWLSRQIQLETTKANEALDDLKFGRRA